MSNVPAWQAEGSLGVSAWARHGQWGAFAPGSLSAAAPHQACEGSTHHAEFTDPMLARARLAGDGPANAGALRLQCSAVPARRARGSRVPSTASAPGTAPEASAESPAASTARPPIASPPHRADAAAASHETVLPMSMSIPTPTPISMPALAMTRPAAPARKANAAGPNLRAQVIARSVVDRSAAAVLIGADGRRLLPTMLARAAATVIGRGDKASPRAADGGVMRDQADVIGNRPPHLTVAVQRKAPGALAAVAATATSATPMATATPATTSATRPPSIATATVPPAPPPDALGSSAVGHHPAVGVPVAQDHADAADAGTTPTAEPAPAASTPRHVAATQSLAMPLLRDHAVGLGPALTASKTALRPMPAAPTARTVLSATNVQRSLGKQSTPLGATAASASASASAAAAATTSQRATSPPPARTVLSNDRLRQPARPSPVEPLPLRRRDTGDATAQREQAAASAVQIIADLPAPAPDRSVPKTADPRGAQALPERVADAEGSTSVEPTAAPPRDSPMLRASAEPSPRAHADLSLRSPVPGQTRQAAAVQRQIEPLSPTSGTRAARQADTGLPTLGTQALSRAGRNEPPAEASAVLALAASAQDQLAPEAMPALAATTAMPISPRQAREAHDDKRHTETPLQLIAARLDSSVGSPLGSPGTAPMAGHVAASTLSPVQRIQRTPSAMPLRVKAQALGPHPTTAPLVASAHPGLPDRSGSGMSQRTAAGAEPEPFRTTPLRARPAAQPGAHAELAVTRMASSPPLSRQALAPWRERPSPSAEPLLKNDAAAAAPTFRALPFKPTWQPSPATQAVASNSPPMTMPTLQRRAMNSMVDRLAEPAASFGERVAEPALEAASAMLRPATMSAPAAAPPTVAPDLEALVERTCARLFETLVIEQERRGVSSWL